MLQFHRALTRFPQTFHSLRYASNLPSWATVDPFEMSEKNPGKCQNLLDGKWVDSPNTKTVIDPLNGTKFIVVPDVASSELDAWDASMKRCSKTGLHNPLKNPQRYNLYGRVASRAGAEMHKPEVELFFMRLIQRVVPKHDAQCLGEVKTVRAWLDSFGGDSVRQLARSFAVPGDHTGQETQGYRFPYGPVSVITPFNFPLEIPSLQTVSALFMGNKPLVKVDEKVAIVMEQFMRMLIHCGMPADDCNFLFSNGKVANELLLRFNPRMTLFTGSQAVADRLCSDLQGRVKLEDAGFDWKILGPDVHNVDYVVWQCDQDAYAFSGQKCSAQSILFMHDNWAKEDFVNKLAERASLRSLDDLTISPVITWTNDKIQAHIENLLKIPGAYVAFGGKPVSAAHSIPSCYGSFEPTAVFVPLEEAMKPEHFSTVTTELFGPLQVITQYSKDQLEHVLEMCERMTNHLTAAVVSNDVKFVTEVLGRTVNGTTYSGIRGRTTGAPQNHWFGPAGDPRAGGIHTAEAIQMVWSCHREIVTDTIVPDTWSVPAKPT